MVWKNWSYTTRGVILFVFAWVLFLTIASLVFLISSGGQCRIQLWAFGPPVKPSFGTCLAPIFFGLTIGLPIILIGSIISGLIGRKIGKTKDKNQISSKSNGGKTLLIILGIILLLIVLSFLVSFLAFLF